MKNTRVKTIGLVVALVCAAWVSACSDGTAPVMPEPKFSTACAVGLEAYKIGETPGTAVTGEITITSGEGIVLVWNTSTVTAAGLTSDPEGVVGQPIVIKEPAATDKGPADSNADDKKEVETGSMEFRDLTHDVNFILTGKNEEKGNKPVDCFGHLNVKVLPLPTEDNNIQETGPVTVPETEPKVVSFTANGAESFLVIDKPGDVELSWEVVPEDAVVTIDHDVGVVSAKGKKTVKISDKTVYTITAKAGEKMAARQVTIDFLMPTVKPVEIVLSVSAMDIFAGEEISFKWEINGATLPSETALKLIGPDGAISVSGTSVALKPKMSGAYYVEASAGMAVFKSNAKNINVRMWKLKDDTGGWTSAHAVKNKDVAMFGSGINTPNAIKTAVLIGNSVWKVTESDFASAFEELYTSNYMKSYLNNYGGFSVNVITDDPTNEKRLYFGTSGGIMYSDGEYGPWKVVDITVVWKGKKERKTCKGETQVNALEKSVTVKNLQRVCDIVVIKSAAGSGRMVAATDGGAYYLDGVDERIADRKDKDHFWQGMPLSESANELADIVVDSLAVYGGKIFAGTAKGVYVSENSGENWSAFNGGDVGEGTAIYKVAVDGDGKKIYAGGPDGLFVNDLGSSAQWKKLGLDGGTVYAIAVNEGSIYVGTATGVYVARNCCPVTGEGKWANITDTMGSAPTVYDIALAKNGTTSAIYVATSEGAFVSVAEVATLSKAVAPTLPEEPAEPETGAMTTIKSLIK